MDGFKRRMLRWRWLGALTMSTAGLLAGMPAPADAYVFPPVRHLFVIVLENQDFTEWYTAGQQFAPYLTQTLPSQGELLPNYYGIGHSSLDNYVAMISGQPPTTATKNDCPDPLTDVPASADGNGIATGNGCVYPANFPTVADQLTHAGDTWRAYEQNIPGPCSLNQSGPDSYARKHNPFVFFRSLRDSGQCAANDVGLDQLPGDLKQISTTPNFTFITPDQCHDAHTDCANPSADPVSQEPGQLSSADGFLKQYVPMIMASPAYKQDGLLAIVFDEGIDGLSCCGEPATDPDGSLAGSELGIPGQGGGQTGAILLSKFVQAGSTVTTSYNHYSLLRSVEEFFGVPPLGEARSSSITPFGSDVFNTFTQPAVPGVGVPAGGQTTTTATTTTPTSTTPTSTTESPQPASGSQSTDEGPPAGSPPVTITCGPFVPYVATLHATRVRGGVRLAGSAAELGCPFDPSSGKISAVFTALANRVGNRCAFMTHTGRFARPGSCTRPTYLATSGQGRWSLSVNGRVPAGRYLVEAIAIDGYGRHGSVRSATVRLH